MFSCFDAAVAVDESPFSDTSAVISDGKRKSTITWRCGSVGFSSKLESSL